MSNINWGSIMKKANAFLHSKEGKAAIKSRGKNTYDEAELVTEAAEMFIEVLRDSIHSSGMSANVASAIDALSHDSAVINDGKAIGKINVYFDGDLSRPSLDVSRYGTLDDLAELFDTGVDHTMKRVWGTWHGNRVGSSTVIPGTHFMESAVSNFLSGYGSEYNVVSVDINRKN